MNSREAPALGVGPGGFGVLERGGGHVVAGLLVVRGIDDLRPVGAVLLLRGSIVAFRREPLRRGPRAPPAPSAGLESRQRRSAIAAQ